MRAHYYMECGEQERETGAWVFCAACESMTAEEYEEMERMRTLAESSPPPEEG